MPGAVFDPLLSQLRTTDQSIFDGRYVLKAGDTMTGNLNVSAASARYILTPPTGHPYSIRSGGTGNSLQFANDSTGNYVGIFTNVGLSLYTGNTAISPTHTLTLPSTGTGITSYNTVDQVTNYERVRQFYSGNTYLISGEFAGTGVARQMRFGTFALSGIGYVQTNTSSGSGFVELNGSTGAAGGISSRTTGTLSSSSGIQYGHVINSIFAQSSTAGYTALLVNPTETSTGSGPKLLIDAQVGGSSKFRIDNNGNTIVQSLTTGYRAVTTTTAMTVNDSTVNATSGTFTITLPTSVGMTGAIYTIKNSGTGNITLATTSSQTIDAATTYPLPSQYKYVTVQSNGANWIVIGNN